MSRTVMQFGRFLRGLSFRRWPDHPLPAALTAPVQPPNSMVRTELRSDPAGHSTCQIRLTARSAKSRRQGCDDDRWGREQGRGRYRLWIPQCKLSARNGNQTASVPDAYTRYLANVFRKTYDLFATPVVIEYRTDANPYDRERRECQSGESARSPESALAIAGADSRLLIGRRSRVKISVRTGAWGYRVCRRQRLNSTGNSWRRAPARCWCSSASRHPLRRPSSATALPTSRFTRPPWHCGTSRSSTA